MLKVSDTYLIGVDIAEDVKESMIIVEKIEGSKREVTRVFHGEAAETFYEKLLKKSK